MKRERRIGAIGAVIFLTLTTLSAAFAPVSDKKPTPATSPAATLSSTSPSR